MESLSGKKRYTNEILCPIPTYPKNYINLNNDLFEQRPENRFRIPTEISSGHVSKYQVITLARKI